MNKGGCTYMITNKNNSVIYIGVTSALRGRIWEHKTKEFSKSFTAKYNCNKIVWYECFPRIEIAIGKRKAIEGWKPCCEREINS